MSIGLWQLDIVLIALLLYFLPTILAFTVSQNKKRMVFAVNLLTGWTGIGWIAALIWAIVGQRTEIASVSREIFE